MAEIIPLTRIELTMICFVVDRCQSQWVLVRKVGHCPTFFVVDMYYLYVLQSFLGVQERRVSP